MHWFDCDLWFLYCREIDEYFDRRMFWLTSILIFCTDEIPLDFEFEKEKIENTHIWRPLWGGTGGGGAGDKDVKGQPGGKSLDING